MSKKPGRLTRTTKNLALWTDETKYKATKSAPKLVWCAACGVGIARLDLSCHWNGRPTYGCDLCELLYGQLEGGRYEFHGKGDETGLLISDDGEGVPIADEDLAWLKERMGDLWTEE